MLWRVFPTGPIPFQASRFILPCQPALAERPPSGPGWLHEIKFDGYRVIARKDGEQVRLWARTTRDYSKAFTRIRDAVAALPVDSAVLDGEAIILRPDNTSDFEALRSRQGQAEAILVAYDIMEVDGQDVRPEPLEERRKRWRAAIPEQQGDARRHPAQRGDHRRRGRHLSSCVLDGPRRHRLEAHRLAVCEWPDAGMAEDEEPELRAAR